MKILVADDDPTSRLIAQTAVRSLGHECHTVTDGTRAWDAFRSHLPDVVMSDWMMPGLTGLELCRLIRLTRPGTTPTSSWSAASVPSTRSSKA